MFTDAIVERLRKNTYLARFITDKAVVQFKRYLVTGFSSFGLEYGIFYICYSVAGLHDVAANTIAYGIIFWFNFLLNRYWSFESRRDLKTQLLQYGILFFVNMGVSDGAMYYLSHVLFISPLLAKIFITGLIVAWNFILYKKVIYR